MAELQQLLSMTQRLCLAHIRSTQTMRIDTRYMRPWHFTKNSLSYEHECKTLVTVGLCGEPVTQASQTGYIADGYRHHQKVAVEAHAPAQQAQLQRPQGPYSNAHLCLHVRG